MDYLSSSLLFKVRKVFRYFKLYGTRRTLVKVRSQFHYAAAFKEHPGSRSGNRGCIAVVGCGTYGYAVVGYYLARHGHRIRSCFDTNRSRAHSFGRSYSVGYVAGSFEEILSDDAVKLVFVASNHKSHTEYAVRLIDAGKAVHIEKPHVVSEQQLDALCNALKRPDARVNLGFNRPFSPLGLRLSEELRGESGPMIINWFIAGHELDPDHWYFSEEEGGRVLGNLCHWTDMTLRLIPPDARYPLTITPTSTTNAQQNIGVLLSFADGSVAAITFSCMGHTFEGVRESLNVHKGNVLAFLEDFQKLRIDNVHEKNTFKLRARDHGHEQNILRSVGLLATPESSESASHIMETGRLMLGVKTALELKEAQFIK